MPKLDRLKGGTHVPPQTPLLHRALVPGSALIDVGAVTLCFLTQTPTTGNSADTFFVFLPVTNIGSGAATNMRLTSVVLAHLGVPATSTILPATLPFATGSGYLAPSGVRTLDLEFDNKNLMAGNMYLLTVRGTYQAGGTTFGFS